MGCGGVLVGGCGWWRFGGGLFFPPFFLFTVESAVYGVWGFFCFVFVTSYSWCVLV